MYIQQIEQVQLNVIRLERMKIYFLAMFSLSSSLLLLKFPTLCILSPATTPWFISFACW